MVTAILLKFLRRKDESGQTLAIFAVFLVGLLAASALIVDGGMMMANRRHVQNAADAAALAAAFQVADGATDAGVHSALLSYAASNGAHSAQGVYLPSGLTVGGGSVPGGTTSIRVQASEAVDLTFASLLGLHSATAVGQATAELLIESGGCGQFVVWAHSNTCTTDISVSGSGTYLNGNIHANTAIGISGSGFTVAGHTEYVTTFTISGSGHTFGYPPTKVAYESEWPIVFNIEDYRPGGRAALAAQAAGKYYVHSGNWSVSGSGKTLPEGLHYVTGNFSGSGSGHSGHVTIVTEGTINWSGSGANLQFYSDGLLFFANQATWCGGSALSISGSGQTMGGIVYAPRGKITDSGSGSRFGSLVAWTINISGSGHRDYRDDICTSQGGAIRVHLVP